MQVSRLCRPPYPGLVILRATIRPHPDTGERRELRAEAPDYEAARSQLEADTPDGWVRLHIITGDPE